MTLLELKKLCKSRGLTVSGTKDEVIIRLMENDETSNIPKNTVTSNVVNPQGFVTINTVQENGMMKIIGTLVILYAFLELDGQLCFHFPKLAFGYFLRLDF